ncbi:MAG: hypothetical protein WCG95_07540 [bacterium]
MLKLTEETAAEIDILLKELLDEKPNPYHGYIDLTNLKTNNIIYKNVTVEHLKGLLYLTMVEQEKESLPIMIRGAKKPVLMDNGEPIRDFLDSGGFKKIWINREHERKLSRNRYWWTNGLVILGVLVTIGVSVKWEQSKTNINTVEVKAKTTNLNGIKADTSTRIDSSKIPIKMKKIKR